MTLLNALWTDLTTPLTAALFLIGALLLWAALRTFTRGKPAEWVVAAVVGLAGLLFVAAANVGLPLAVNTAMLESLPSTQYLTVTRLGYAALGDAPPLQYRASDRACSLNGGAGDGGSQIRSADNKCWLAVFPAAGADIREWGADPTATRDSTAALANAIHAMSGGRVLVDNGRYLVTPGVVATGDRRVIIEGSVYQQGHENGGGSTCEQGGLIAHGGSGALLTLSANSPSAMVRNLCIEMAASPAAATGTGIAELGNQQAVENVIIYNACIGVDMAGNSNMLRFSRIEGMSGAGCNGIRVGYTGSGGLVTDPYIAFNQVAGDAAVGDPPCNADLQVLDAGGITAEGNDFLYCNYGTQIVPGVFDGRGQAVAWGGFRDTLGDTNHISGLAIDTADPAAAVEGLQFVQTWTAYTTFWRGGSDVVIKNSSHGTVNGVHFIGHRAFSAGQHGFDLFPGVSDVTIDASTVCGNGGNAPATYSGINLEDGFADGAFRNNKIASTCDNVEPTYVTANCLNIGMGVQNIIITGNDLSGCRKPVAGVPAGSAVVANNRGVDDHIPSHVDTAMIILGAEPAAAITGIGTAITTLNGYWNGRQIILFTTDGSIAFETGGNLCNSTRSTIDVPILGLYDAAEHCWHLK